MGSGRWIAIGSSGWEEASSSGGAGPVDPEASPVDHHVVMEPAEGGEVGVVVIAIAAAFLDVMRLESIARAAPVGGAHAAVPPQHVTAGSRWDGGAGVPDPQRFTIIGEGDQIDRRFAQQPFQRGRSDPGPDAIQAFGRTACVTGGIDEHGGVWPGPGSIGDFGGGGVAVADHEQGIGPPGRS